MAVWEVKGGSGNHGKSNRTSRSGGFVEIWRFSGPWGAACGLQAGGSEGEGLISVWDLVEGSRDTLRARGEVLEQIPWVSEPAEAGTVAWRARGCTIYEICEILTRY